MYSHEVSSFSSIVECVGDIDYQTEIVHYPDHYHRLSVRAQFSLCQGYRLGMTYGTQIMVKLKINILKSIVTRVSNFLKCLYTISMYCSPFEKIDQTQCNRSMDKILV